MQYVMCDIGLPNRTVLQMLLLLAGIIIYIFGNRTRCRSLRPDGVHWPLRSTIMSIPKWEHERTAMLFGGAALQFGGIIMIFRSIPMIF
jgi:hypothetical protein